MENEQNTEDFAPQVQSTPNETGEEVQPRPSKSLASTPRVSFSDDKLESSSIFDVQPFDQPTNAEVSASKQPSILELTNSYNENSKADRQISGDDHFNQSSVPKSFIRSSAMVSTPRASIAGTSMKRHSRREITPHSFQEVTKKLEKIDAHLKQKKDQTQTLELLVQELASLMLDQAPVAREKHSIRKSMTQKSEADRKLPKILHSLCSRIIDSGIENLDFEELRYFHEEIYHAASKLVNARNPEARMLTEVANMRQQIDVLNNEIQKVRCALQCPRKTCPK